MVRTLIAFALVTCTNMILTAQAPPVDGSRFSPKHAPTCEIDVIVPDLIQYWEESFPVFTGKGVDDASLVNVVRLDTDSLGIIDLLVVTDTAKVTEYEWQRYEYKELVKRGNGKEYRSIVCEHRRSGKLIKKMQSALIDKRFLSKRNKSGSYDARTKSALKKFQLSKGLGYLHPFDLEILDLLGIKTNKYRPKE